MRWWRGRQRAAAPASRTTRPATSPIEPSPTSAWIDWEVARDGSFDGDDSCLSLWVFDYDQRLLFLFGNR